MGTDRPLLVQYADWVSSFVVGDMGHSYAYRTPVAPLLEVALLNSAKLALVAFLLDSSLLHQLAWATAAVGLYAIWDYSRVAGREKRPLGGAGQF